MWLDQPVNIMQITVLNQLTFSLYNYREFHHNCVVAVNMHSYM